MSNGGFLSGDEPDDIDLTETETDVLGERAEVASSGPPAEHPNHPEVAGQPDPNG